MRAYLGLGSNLGDRRANIEEALRRLDATDDIRVVTRSSICETDPVGGPEQPRYMNAACEVETRMSPRELLRAALAVESDMGRKRGVRWGPRVIDIDILIAGHEVLDDPDLTVPHPLMTEREFVLRPLAEIAPDLRHPGSGRDIRSLLADVLHLKAATERTRAAMRGQEEDTE
jgi:2-amino-4-hydroxy-6-hydroxymethyldihydropteridine diphosphokinase